MFVRTPGLLGEPVVFAHAVLAVAPLVQPARERLPLQRLQAAALTEPLPPCHLAPVRLHLTANHNGED